MKYEKQWKPKQGKSGWQKQKKEEKKEKEKKTKKESSRRIWDLRQRERNGEVRGRGEKAGSNKIP